MDLSSKLKKEKPTLKLAEGVEFEVDNSADTYLLVQDKIKDKDFSIDVMYDMIEILMGKEALDKIKEMDKFLNFKLPRLNYKNPGNINNQ